MPGLLPACLPIEGRADRGWWSKHTIVDPVQLELLIDALLLLLGISRTINHLGRHGGCWTMVMLLLVKRMPRGSAQVQERLCTMLARDERERPPKTATHTERDRYVSR